MGDELLAKIYKDYSQDCYLYAFYFTKNKEQAQDLVSEAFLVIAESLDELNEKQINYFLLKIIKNRFIDWTRKQTVAHRWRKFPSHVFQAESQQLSTPLEEIIGQERKRAEKAEENFQIGQAFIAGRAFFSFVKHYEDLKDELCTYLEEEVKKLFENDKNGGDKIIFKEVMGWIGFRHAWNLFECVCLSFVDKFSLETFKGNYEYFAHLLEWAMIIRVRKQRVSFAGINKYVLGLDEGINVDNMFAVIDQARLPSEILERALPLDEKSLTRNKADPKDYPQGIQQGSSKDNWDRLKNILIALN